MTRGLLSDIREEVDSQHLYDETVELLMRSLGSGNEERVYFDGTLHLFEQPEFRDVERAKALLGFLEHEDALASLLSELSRRSGTQVTIGQEHRQVEMHECSMVTATYRVGQTVVGTVGVLGPTRMDYAKVVSAVGALADSLTEVLTQMSRRSA